MEYPLMLDLAIPKDLDQTKNFLKEVSFLKPYWIEEPVDGENISLLTEIKNGFDMKVVTGEKQSGLPHFKEIIKRDAAVILNPDICKSALLPKFFSESVRCPLSYCFS